MSDKVAHSRTCRRCGQLGISCEVAEDGGGPNWHVVYRHTCGCSAEAWTSPDNFEEDTFVCPLCGYNYTSWFTGGIDLELTEILSSGGHNPDYYVKLANESDGEIVLHKVHVQLEAENSIVCLEAEGIRLLPGDVVSIQLPGSLTNEPLLSRSKEVRWQTTAGSTWWTSRSFDSIRDYIQGERARSA